jgi:DNA-binding transcriptional regulator YhcF (GntR family)
MEFTDHQAIYLQIVHYICEQLILKKWLAEEKLPSIRDMAIELQVTPNTVQRSYDFLQELGIISNRRGVGIFVERDALKKVLAFKKTTFLKEELPVIFRNMYLLKMDPGELEPLFNQYLKTQSKNNT